MPTMQCGLHAKLKTMCIDCSVYHTCEVHAVVVGGCPACRHAHKTLNARTKKHARSAAGPKLYPKTGLCIKTVRSEITPTLKMCPHHAKFTKTCNRCRPTLKPQKPNLCGKHTAQIQLCKHCRGVHNLPLFASTN
jgi:hypothetical protein